MPGVSVNVLTPAGMLGYGFPAKWFEKGLSLGPDVIAVDSGSTDSGPHKLGTGAMTCSMEAYRKDIGLLLRACAETSIPVFISSAGGDGADQHVDVFLQIISDIARDKGYRFKIAAIYSDQDKQSLKAGLRSGRISPCGPVPELLEEEIDRASTIVAQMGVEPYLKVLKENDDVDIIVSGRTYDPVPISALGILNGFDPGLAWHMGKIMECGALCAEPSGKNIFGVLERDHFILEPLNPAERCTSTSVAAHTLYEKSHPYLLQGPGGVLDVSRSTFAQLDERRVKVSGSKFIPSRKYTLKLEGAKRIGYRSIFIAGVRDPILIQHLDEVIERVTGDVREYFSELGEDSYKMIFHLYGRNGVMGEFEPERQHLPKEVCVILEVAAPSQEIAIALCSKARTEMLHCPYEGRMATAGNLAFPFTPLEIPLGEVCEFNVYHLMEVDDPVEPFRIKYVEVRS